MSDSKTVRGHGRPGLSHGHAVDSGVGVLLALATMTGLGRWFSRRKRVLTVVASWLLASTRPSRPKLSFWICLLSHLLWVAGGAHTSAMALVVMQFGLAALNIRAARPTSAAVAC